MAKSYTQYVGDGATNQFNLTFSYLDQSHVFVTFNGVSQTFSWINPSRIQTAATPIVGAVVKVYRSTPTTALVIYPPTSTLRGSDLTTAQQQCLYGIEEDAEDLDTLAVITAADEAAAAASLIGSTFASLAPVSAFAPAPTGSEATGTRYIVSVSATGAFVGKDNQIAQKNLLGGWDFSGALQDRISIYVASTKANYAFTTATGWAKECVYVAPGSDLQAAMTAAAFGAITFLPGTYTGVNIAVASNVHIEALGPVVLQTTSNTLPILDFSSAINVSMRGHWKLQGNGANSNTGVIPLTGPVNNGQVGIKLGDSVGIDIDGYIEICNISGYGIDEHAPSSTFRVPGLNSIRGLRVHDCYFGAYVREFAEYSTYTNCWFYSNIAGIKDESGNRGYDACVVVDNNYGFFFDGSVETGNNSHGIVSGCFINHNNINIVCDGTQLGMLFTGCQILSDESGGGVGTISIIDGAKLIQFVGCDIGATISIDATSQASGIGNTIRSTLSVAPVVTAGGVWVGSGNVTETGSFLGLWNSFNSWTPVLSFGGASVGISYSYQNARYQLNGGYLDFSGEITLTSKGSSVGNALIGGLPVSSGPVPANTPVTITGTAMNAAVTDLKGFVGAADSGIKLFNFNAGSITQLTDAAFTGTDTIYFSGRIPLG